MDVCQYGKQTLSSTTIIRKVIVNECTLVPKIIWPNAKFLPPVTVEQLETKYFGSIYSAKVYLLFSLVSDLYLVDYCG